MNTIALMCPTPSSFEKTNGLKDAINEKLLDFLKDMKWRDLFQNIIISLETEGDAFFQICYDSTKKEYYLLPLESSNMVEIKKDLLGKDNLYYKYEKTRTKTNLNIDSGVFEDSSYTDVFIFTKNGYYFYNGEYPTTTPTFIPNTPLMGDIIPIVHIPSLTNSKKWTGFSNIPAVSYFDVLNILITQDTDRRLINRLAGFPRLYITDGHIDKDKSSLDVGGQVAVKTDKDANPNELFGSGRVQAQVKHMEINNGMSPINEERKDTFDILFNLAGLMRPRLEERMGASDSSKAIAQFRIGQEAKNRKYLENIREGFSTFFGIVVEHMEGLNKTKTKTKNKEKEDLKKIYLEVPAIVINSSIFDEISLITQEMSIGVKTLRETLQERGWTKEQIDQHEEELKNEVFQASGKDVDIVTPLDGKQQKISNNLRKTSGGK